MDALVSTEWLAAELGKSDLRVIDATLQVHVRAGVVVDADAECFLGHDVSPFLWIATCLKRQCDSVK